MKLRATPSRLLVIVAGTVVTGCLAQHAEAQTLAQDGGPVVVGQNKPQFERFVLERLSVSLELLARYEKEEHDPDIGETIKETETLFREELELSTDSYIGHEDLVDLSANIRFRLEQNDVDTNAIDGVGYHESYLTLYDVNAIILQQSKLPLTVYAKRNQIQINRTFSGNIDSTTTEYGTSLAVRSDLMPTRFSYFHRDQVQSGPGNSSDFTLAQDTFFAEGNLVISRRQALGLDYSYDVVDQSSDSIRDTVDRRHDFNAIHTLKFGQDLKHNLRSSFNYVDRDSRSVLRRFRVDELLQLEHTRRLRSRIDGHYEERSQNGLEQTFARASGQIRHKLFESLVTAVTVGASRNELDNSLDNESVHADLFLDYTKRVPFGRLDSGVSFGAVDQRNGERGTTVRVDNNSRVFNDPFPIIISRRFIEPNSILVSDASDIRIFVEGADYTVRVLSDRTEIRRVVGGAISDGETVLIDYAIGPEPGSDVFTTTTAVSVRYSLSQGRLAGLGVYGRLNTINQEVDTSDPSAFTFEDRTFAEYGVDYRYRGLNLTLEREHLWSNVSPFESTRMTGMYTHRVGRTSVLSFDSSYSVIDFKDDDNRVELARARGSWAYRFNPDLDFKIRLTYRDEKDDLSGDSTGFEQLFEMRWHRNQTDVILNASNSFLNTSTSENTFQLVSISLRRSF